MPYFPGTSGYAPKSRLVPLTHVNIESCGEVFGRREGERMPFVLTSNYKSDTMCRFGMAAGGQVGWWKLGDPECGRKDLIPRFQRLDFGLFHQEVALASFQAERVLAVTRFRSADVPTGMQ